MQYKAALEGLREGRQVEIEAEVEGRSLVFLGATACCRSLRKNPEALILILPWAQPQASLSLSRGRARNT